MKQSHMTRLAALVVAVSMVGGCATQTQNTAAGAGIGAAVGAGLGALIGDSSKAAAIGAGIGGLAGGVAGYNWDRLQGNVNKAGARQLGISTTQMADGSLKVNIPDGASFEVGRYEVKPALYPVLNVIAQEFAASPQLRLATIGHTDSTGSEAINRPLSQNRAAAVNNILASHGIAAQRMHSEGRSSHEPIADNSTAAGRAANRRVEIYLYAVQQ